MRDQVSTKDASFVDNVVDFGTNLFDSGVQKPINAVIEAVDWMTGKELPKLQLVVPERTDTFGAQLGSISGAVADIYLLSKGVGRGMGAVGVAETGLMGTAARLGTTGFVYGSVFTPTQPEGAGHNDDFLWNRTKNGLIQGGTWASIGLATAGGEKIGLFRAPALTSLHGAIIGGASTGAIGGLVHAELNATLNQGRLATLNELGTDMGNFAAAGGMFGALGWANKEIANSIGQRKAGLSSRFDTSDDFVLETKRAADGDLIGVRIHDRSYRSIADTTYTKDASGNWMSRIERSGDAPRPLAGVKQLADGTVAIVDMPTLSGDKFMRYVSIYSPGYYGSSNYLAGPSPDISSSQGIIRGLSEMVQSVNQYKLTDFLRDHPKPLTTQALQEMATSAATH